MCGRFTLTFTVQEVKKEFEVDEVLDEFKPSYNIAPGQDIAVIMPGSRILTTMNWGLVLPWMLEQKKKLNLINARIENIQEKKTYEYCFTRQRCLIPASGFYEWKKEREKKVPHYITLKSQKMFAFAGIYSIVKDDGKERKTCSIITTEPNELMKKIHNRMPQIMLKEQYKAWMDTNNQGKQELLSLLRPLPSQAMQTHEVSAVVNDVRYDAEMCIRAIKPSSQGR